MPQRFNWLDWTSLVVVVIGALNWGLIGFFNYDLIAAIFGGGNTFATVPRVLYAIVGLAGLYSIYSLYKVGQIQAQVRRPAEERMRRAA
ncbi:MAG TPA: DUF378 domain-containing protein [Anaerolineae bacterium]|nr:DUF378 domain-containing protein [Anaerolineae bacterium]